MAGNKTRFDQKGRSNFPLLNSGPSLYLAAKNGNLAVADLLLSEGTGDINAVYNKRRTALLRASSAGHTAIVNHLLDMHADPMIPDDCGTTCIGVASRNGHLEVVQRLVGQAADWGVQDDSRLDALQWAVWEGRHDVESFLLSVGGVILDDNRYSHATFTSLGGSKRLRWEGLRIGNRSTKSRNKQAEVNASRARKRRKDRIGPNSKFADIEAIRKSQVEVGEVDDDSDESSDLENPSDSEECIVVAV